MSEKVCISKVERVERVSIIPVWPRVLVPESDDMSQFVNDNSKLIAVVADGYGLRPIASFADERTASARTHLFSEITNA